MAKCNCIVVLKSNIATKVVDGYGKPHGYETNGGEIIAKERRAG